MTTDDRPQDQGRRHRKRGQPSAATVSLLEAYQDAMRRELRELLTELEGTPQAPGQLLDGSPAPAVKRPSLRDRAGMWDLAMKIGRELGSQVDQPPPPAPDGKPTGPRRGRVDFG
jgi:hypothetical protein